MELESLEILESPLHILRKRVVCYHDKTTWKTNMVLLIFRGRTTVTIITEMTKKSKLIQNDPVTCARLFDHMVHLLINNFINDEDKPIGDVRDSFLQG